MNDVVQINVMLVSIVGAFIVALLSIITFFLSRFLKQFDGLINQVSVLNITMLRIDADIQIDVSKLKMQHETLTIRVEDFHPLWDRVRTVEGRIIKLEGHCEVMRGVMEK